MKRAILAGLGLISSIGSVSANGGGYSRGGATGGDVAGFEPQATENVRILDEQLTARVAPEAADVEVRYLMRNETAEKVKVRFGFPVDETRGDGLSRDGQVKKTPANVPEHCQNYRISAAGKPLDAAWKAEPKPKAGSTPDKRFDGLRGWYVSELAFAPNEEKTVSITFRSGYAQAGSWVSNNGTLGRALFNYRLSTAACWAGSIGKGRIVLQPVGIDPAELKVIKPVNRFRKQGSSWVWTFEDLEPTLADDIVAEVEPEQISQSGDNGLNHGRDGRWFYCSTEFSTKASSTLAADGKESYDSQNVAAGNDHVWSEGAQGSGAGEWLELKPAVARPLLAVEIRPGFQRTPELFKANARPKAVTMILNGEKKIKAEFPDAPVLCRIPVAGYDKPVKTIKLVFDGVWPGSKYEDMCVSSVALEVKLPKKPKAKPVR